jgi:SEC-C motif
MMLAEECGGRGLRGTAQMPTIRCRMLSTGQLTTDDLDEIGHSSFDSDQPLKIAAELIEAVDRGMVADGADTGYALILAAEITDRAGDLQGAQLLAARALEANRVNGDPEGYPRAFHAELLLRLGREDEAMAELAVLRPLMSEDDEAVSYISEALESGGHAETAERWLTEDLVTMLQRRNALESQRGGPAYKQAAVMAFALVQERHRVRRDLDLPHDEHDHLADQLMNMVFEALSADESDHAVIALLFWPQPEFDRLLPRWPVLTEEYGHTWDEYRTTVQRTLVLWAESGHPRLVLLAGAVDELADYAERTGGDPTESQVREAYVDQLAEHSREIAWPPGRNQACWCGSGLKYKKCCLPRGRT